MKTLALALIFAGAAAAATEAVLYKFQGNQGVLPAGRLIADASGRIYGVTELGGTPGCGTVFQLTPPTAGAGWTAATLYEFQGGADGCSPGTDILLATDASGNFYGTTRGGGTGTCVGNYTGCGTVFQLAPPALAGGAWTETVLYKFASGGDGAFPNGGVVLGPNGVFYGTTSDTGDSGHYGSAFVLHPPVIPGGAWTKTTLYTFTGGADGNSPFGNLSRDRNGNLYGITLAGGAKGWGAVFEISQAKPGLWTETVLYSFLGLPDGYNPPSGVVRDKAGNLYGVTSSGGATNHGTIYELSPPVQAGGAWTYAVLYSFLGAPDGYYPIGSPSLDPSGNLFGTTSTGGTNTNICRFNGCGTVYKLAPPAQAGGAWTETVLYRFLGNSDASDPQSSLLRTNSGTLYGTAVGGGGSNSGSFFSVHP